MCKDIINLPIEYQLLFNEKYKIINNSIIIYNQNVYIYHTLGIHLGLLGILLSLIQLITICIALINHSKQIKANEKINYEISLSTEFICLISNSLATDSILCARLYLLTAFIIGLFIILYIKSIIKYFLKITQLSNYEISKIFLYQYILRNNNNNNSNNSQQSFAYIALMHSLPWALSAGTALLIAFSSFYPINQYSTEFNPIINETQIFIKNIKPTVNVLFQGLDSLLTCSIKLSSETIITYTSYKQLLNYTGIKLSFNWFSSFLLIILPLIIQTLVIILFITLIFIIRYINQKKTSNRNRFKLSNKSFLVILFILLIEIISLCTPILYNIIISLYPNYKIKLILISRMIMLHLLIDPLLIICILQKFWKDDKIFAHISKYDSINNLTSSSINEPIQSDLFNTNNQEMKIIENKETKSLHSSPIQLFNCFPMNTNTFCYNRTPNLQSFVMPYLPASEYLLPTIDSICNSTGLTDTKLHTDMNSSGFILPVSGISNETSSHMIANTLHSIYSDSLHDTSINHNSISIRNNQLITNPTSLSDTLQTSETDTSHSQIYTYGNIQEAFPQLCQHHQRLLEQQYEQPCITTTVKRNRNFGSVPRLKQPIPDLNTLLNVKPINESLCRQHSPPPMNNTKPEITTEIISSFQYRQTMGQSTATAAVMAAAAAAVAAQAGKLSKPINSTISMSTIDPLNLTNGMPPSPLFVSEQKEIDETFNDINSLTN
ncbi:unnamed protein product [Heterobilharzia americana]|nr:unnamed protein product [Heterobilharzia americana]